MTKHQSENSVQKSDKLVPSVSEVTRERKGLFSYFRHAWAEFKKVVWPTRDEAVKMTFFVVVFVAVLALFVYVADSAISWLFFDVLLKRG